MRQLERDGLSYRMSREERCLLQCVFEGQALLSNGILHGLQIIKRFALDSRQGQSGEETHLFISVLERAGKSRHCGPGGCAELPQHEYGFRSNTGILMIEFLD